MIITKHKWFDWVIVINSNTIGFILLSYPSSWARKKQEAHSDILIFATLVILNFLYSFHLSGRHECQGS